MKLWTVAKIGAVAVVAVCLGAAGLVVFLFWAIHVAPPALAEVSRFSRLALPSAARDFRSRQESGGPDTFEWARMVLSAPEVQALEKSMPIPPTAEPIHLPPGRGEWWLPAQLANARGARWCDSGRDVTVVLGSRTETGDETVYVAALGSPCGPLGD